MLCATARAWKQHIAQNLININRQKMVTGCAALNAVTMPPQANQANSIPCIYRDHRLGPYLALSPD